MSSAKHRDERRARNEHAGYLVGGGRFVHVLGAAVTNRAIGFASLNLEPASIVSPDPTKTLLVKR